MKFKKGQPSWNKGLTKETDERLKKSGEKQSKTKKGINYEQKYGIERAKEIKNKIGKSLKGRKISEKLRKLSSIRMRLNNPMKNIETKNKVSNTLKELYKRNKIKSWCKEIKGEEFLEHFKNGHPKGMLGKKGIIKLSEEAKRKMSVNMKGDNNPSKRQEVREKISLAKKGKKCSEETKKKISLAHIGEKNSFYGKHHSEKSIEKIIKSNKEKGNYNRISKRMKNGGALKARMSNIRLPNKPEKIMIDLIEKNNLPFNYVGDGKVWFEGETQSFNPDFLSKNPKHIIELFGDYWHKNTQERDKERLETYHKLGYKTLVIWEHELKNPIQVIERVKTFMEISKDEKNI